MEKELTQRKSDIIKIAFLGPECTGKTTISRLLAEEFNTEWVPEFMRTYLQKKWDEKKQTCQQDDLPIIAQGQLMAENQAVSLSNKFLFCDTTLLELVIYSYAYYQKCNPTLEKMALENAYDLIFLTDIDMPWQADDLRDKPNERNEMFAFFREKLILYKKDFVILSGNLEERKKKCISIIKNKFS